LDTRRRFANSEALAAHITFAHDPALRIVTRHVVWTFQNAVLAPDALIVQMLDDPGRRIFFVSIDRTSVETCRINAMMAGGGE